MNLQLISPWLLATRPKTLTASLVPVLLGSALVFFERSTVDLKLSFFIFFSALCIQIGTNFVNDAADYSKGADTSERLGPRRATQQGWLSVRSVYFGAILFFLLAIVFALPLIQLRGWPLLATGALSILCAYAYTAGPIPLAYVGLGELFVLIFFGWVAVCGTFYVHTGLLSPAAFLIGLQVGSFSAVLISINNARDARTDALVKKNTLAVRFGPRFAKFEILFFLLLPYALNIFWIFKGAAFAAFLPLISFSFAQRLCQKIWKQNAGPEYNAFLAEAAFVQMLFAAFLSVGLCLK